MQMEMSNSSNPKFSVNYRVYINHTDAGGIVYHANHLTFFENCRRDWFAKLGVDGYFLRQTADNEALHFVVSHADLRYHQAILLDEVISVRVDGIELRGASAVFFQSIWGQDEEKPRCTAEITLVCVKNNALLKKIQSVRIPDAIRQLLG